MEPDGPPVGRGSETADSSTALFGDGIEKALVQLSGQALSPIIGMDPHKMDIRLPFAGGGDESHEESHRLPLFSMIRLVLWKWWKKSLGSMSVM